MKKYIMTDKELYNALFTMRNLLYFIQEYLRSLYDGLEQRIHENDELHEFC